jgi:4-hydroxy-tetrahydrodipicolinate synthase
MTIPKWEGVYPAMLTPFTKDDSIDFEMFKINVNAQLDAGVDGLVVGGSLGEASTMLAEEKWELLR